MNIIIILKSNWRNIGDDNMKNGSGNDEYFVYGRLFNEVE